MNSISTNAPQAMATICQTYRFTLGSESSSESPDVPGEAMDDVISTVDGDVIVGLLSLDGESLVKMILVWSAVDGTTGIPALELLALLEAAFEEKSGKDAEVGLMVVEEVFFVLLVTTRIKIEV